ncbi:MAG: cytochrome b [Candidatus Eiseniibacteriota bacterium]
MKPDLVTRYHPLLVTLHWLLAFFLIAALVLGFAVLAEMPNADPRKVDILRAHMTGGVVIFTLMLIRFIVRLATARPPLAATGHRLVDRLAPLAHYGFYVLVLLMVATGFATALAAGLPAIVFGGSGAPLPASFEIFPTFAAHETIAALLVALIALHVLAALYHQVVKKDGLLRRVGYGRRRVAPAE